MNFVHLYIFFFTSLIGVWAFLFKKKYFILIFFFILLIQPIFQKLSDPSIWGETLRDITIVRIATNLVFIIDFILIALTLKFRTNKSFWMDSIFIFVFMLCNLCSTLLSEDIIQSINLYIVAIIQPILFYYLLQSIEDKYYNNLSFIYKTVSYIICSCFFLGVAFFIQQDGMNITSFISLRGNNGLWINNFSLQILSLLFPIALHNGKQGKGLMIVVFIVIVLMELLALSRMMIVVLFLQLLLMVYYKLFRFSSFLLILCFIMASVVIASLILDIDLLKLILLRFHGAETSVIETSLNDARFYIYEEAFNLVKENFIFGIGLGNFYKYTYDGFSDCHNLYLSVLVMRGMIVFVLVIYFFYAFLKKNISYARQYHSTEIGNTLYCLRIGMIGYLLSSMTGSELYIYSGLCNAWPMYFIIFVFVLQEKIGRKTYDKSKFICKANC